MAITVAVYGPNLRTTAEQLHVHRPGCADTDKALYRGHQSWTVEVDSVQDVVHAIYDLGDFCYDADGEWERYLDDIKIFPCVPDLPHTTTQPEGEIAMATTVDTVPVRLPSALVREATADALKLLPAGSKSRVDGEDLLVADGEGQAVVVAITDHMRAIVKANRSANMYREGKLRQVRSAILAAVPDTTKPGAKRPTLADGAGKATPRSAGKAAERIATLNAHKAAASAARDAGHPIPDGQLATMDAAQAGKVERARRTRQAPPAMASAI